jgi:hypothetical protein
MKKLYAIFMFAFVISNAQTASITFLYNVKDANATSVDIELINQSTSAQIAKINGIDSPGATTMQTVPSNTLITVKFFKAGTSTVYYTSTNNVFNDNAVMVAHLYGNSSLKTFSRITSYLSAPASYIKYAFVHSSNTMPEIDLVINSSGTILADNFVKSDNTGFTTNFLASDMVLSLTPYNSTTPLYSYTFNGASKGGSYIYFFLSDNDLYMLETNGTVTKLGSTTTDVLDRISWSQLSVYPNPVGNKLNLQASDLSRFKTFQIVDLKGNMVRFGNVSTSTQIETNDLPAGLYFISLSNEKEFASTTFVKE